MMRAILIIVRAISFLGLSSAAMSPCTWQYVHCTPSASLNIAIANGTSEVAARTFKFLYVGAGPAPRPAGCCATSETDATSHKRKILIISPPASFWNVSIPAKRASTPTGWRDAAGGCSMPPSRVSRSITTEVPRERHPVAQACAPGTPPYKEVAHDSGVDSRAPVCGRNVDSCSSYVRSGSHVHWHGHRLHRQRAAGRHHHRRSNGDGQRLHDSHRRARRVPA